MSRFDNPRNTAPSLEALQNQFLKVPRSTHDYSCTKHFNAWCGVIMPIDHIDTLPNEDYELDYDLIVESISALQKNLKTGFTLYVHAFYMRDSQLWEGAENFYTKGRSGSVALYKPCLNVMVKDTVSGNLKNTCSVLSLCDFLDVPVFYYYHGTSDTNAPTLLNLLDLTKTQTSVPNRSTSIPNFSALPFVMYQRIYTEFYMNQNLLINNKGVLPDNVNHMILPYSAGNEPGNTYHQCNYLDYSNPLQANPNNTYSVNPDGDFYVPSASNQKPLHLAALRYRQKKGDYFTTALPFQDLVRGSIPSLNLSDLGGSASLDASSVFSDNDTTVASAYMPGIDSDTGKMFVGMVNNVRNNVHDGTSVPDQVAQSAYISALNNIKVNFSMSLTLANLRALESYTIFAERMARTNGKYNDMIKAQFGYNPHAKTLDPIYIGGFYQNIDIVSVTQTSPDSSSGTSTNGVGSLSSKAISAGRNNIGHFHSPDYGHIMICASIVPDMVYSNQGADRNSTKITQAETYFPLLENLSPQVILNRELFISGTTSTDNSGFGWTELFSEYKSRQNKAYGLIGASDPGNSFALDSGAYVMKYLFSSTPTLSNEFETLSPKNIPSNIWQSPSDVPFILTVGCHVRKTTCMSYITQPGGLSSRLG